MFYKKMKKDFFLLNSMFFGVMSTFVIMIPYRYDGLIFDLRAIPIIFATYCYGWKVGLAASLIPILYRYLYVGGLSPLFIVITITLHFVIPIVVSQYFRRKDGVTNRSLVLNRSLIMIGIIYVICYFVIGIIVQFISTLLLIKITLSLLLISLVSLLVISYMRNEDIQNSIVHLKMIRSEKMEVVSHLAASISHEVRNPLTVVKGFLQLLDKDNSGPKQKKYIELSIQEIERANDIIVNYLTFAKPAPENIEILNINEEVQRAISIIKPLANMNSVQLDAKTEDYYIQGESQLLQQCLLNIIKNCIEAMPNGGIVYMTTKREKDRLLLKIVDNGKGMNKEELSRLGEPYFTTKDEGTGLGMMAAIRIIEVLKGEIEVTSKLHRGTIFKLYFPIYVLIPKSPLYG